MSNDRKWPQRYEPSSEVLVDITQEWCDEQSRALNRMGVKQQIVKDVLSINPHTQYELLRKISELIQQG